MSHGLRATSPPVASTTFEAADDEATTIRFALFETKRVLARARDASSVENRAEDGRVREDYASYVGGSVWALDWHPSERAFAVAARGEGHHAHEAKRLGTCRGDVGAQIWRVRENSGPEMMMMLLGNGGCVTDAKWAPEVSSTGRTDEDDALGRLAVSLGDSRVEVWTVPRSCPSTSRTQKSNVSFAGIVPEAYGAPLCVDWNAVVPGRLAAGYSSGRVVVWDVDDDDDALGTAPTYPKFVVTAAAQSGPCRVVRWPPLEHPEDASVCANVFAAGADNAAKPHLLDLRAPFAPVGDVFERGAPWILDMVWLPRGSLVAGMESSDRASAKTLRSASSSSAAAASKSLIQQFDLSADADDDGAQPVSTYQMPGRGAPWGIDARASANPRCAAAMVACASSNGVVAVSPLRFVGKRLRAASRPAFETCAGLRARDDETNATMRANPVEPPTCFEFIVPGADDVGDRADAFPRGAAAAPGSRDAPTTAQHRVRWSRAPSGEWWLASGGEAGFVRVQRFDDAWAERRLEQLERLHAGAREKT
jgi:general transcription factor 3C polypeptide 2